MDVSENQKTRGVQVNLDELIALRQRASGFKLAAPRRVANSAAGIMHSRFRGRGVDYVESRGYQPGDDIRHMDWRVTARSGRPHTKLFQEERERTVLLVLDCGASLRFGTRLRYKSVQAARVAALLAWIAVQNGNRIGILGFGGGVHTEVRPMVGQRGALRCLRALVDWHNRENAMGATETLSQALARARRLVHPGGLVVLLSDGFSADAVAAAPLRSLAAHCDIAAVLLTDILEMSPPPPGRYAVHAGECNRVIDFGNVALRAMWPKLFAERRAALIGMLNKNDAPWITMDTRAEPGIELVKLLAGIKMPRVAQ